MVQEKPENGFGIFHLLSSYILFLFSMQVMTISLSLLEVRISPFSARTILGISTAIGLVFFFKDKELLKSLAFSKRVRRWQIPFLCFLGIVIMTYIVLWAAAYIMPDLSYDGNFYHIPAISMWDVRGYISWVKTIYAEPLINGYPKGAELVSYILLKAFNNSVINTVNLVFLPLGILSIAYLARSLGAGRLLSMCAGAAFLFIPVNINQSVTTYVDSSYASCVVGSIASLIHLSRTRSLEWKGLVIFGAALGLTLCTKSTGIALCGIAMLALAGIWIKDIFFSTSLPGKRAKPNQWVKTTLQRLALLLSVSLIAMIGGGYWYIRNYFMSGTPLYPVGVAILGHTLFPGVSISEAISEYSMIPVQLRSQLPIIRDLYTWAQGLKAWPLSIKGYDTRDAGLGFLWLFASIPSICLSIFFLPKLTPEYKRRLFLLIGVTGLAFLTTPLNWWARFTAWIYALGLPCFALVLANFVFNSKVIRWRRYIATIWMTFCVAFLFFEAVYCTVDIIALASPGPLRSNLGNIFKPGTWDWPANYLLPDLKGTAIEDVLTQPGNVVIGPHGDMEFWRYAGLIGELAQPIGVRHLEFINESQGESGQIGLGDVKYIIWDETVILPPALASLTDNIAPAGGFLVLSLK